MHGNMNMNLCAPCSSSTIISSSKKGSTGEETKFIAATKSKSKRASSRKNRVYVLRSFLLEKYPELLIPGSAIADIAGGKGDLSWILSNADGLDPIVCDPRVAKHTHLLRSVHYLFDHPEEAALRAQPGLDTHQPLASLIPKLRETFDSEGGFREPKHLRIHVDSELIEAVSSVLMDSGRDELMTLLPTWARYWDKATKKAESARPLGYLESEDGTSGRLSDSFSALRAILGIKLIVGFHPDQATEACIDLALVLRVPFAVVPCCVFPSEFKSRINQDGKRVRTYVGFIEYLHHKVPFARSEALNFHNAENARNIVLFTLSKDLCNYPSVSKLEVKDVNAEA